jgi:streptogramin lyase
MRGSAIGSAFAAAVIAAGCGGGERKNATSPDGSAEAVTASGIPPEQDLIKEGAEVLPIPGDFMTAGGGRVWTNVRADFVHVPEAPCQGGAFGFGAFWTATCTEDGLARVDATTHEVRHVDLDTPSLYGGSGAIAAGEGAVWMVVDGEKCEACVLVGVDPESMKVTHRLDLDEGASSVGVGFGSVWVTNPEADTVTRVDHGSDEVRGETTVEGSAQFLAVGESAVWVFDQLEGNVIELDPDGMEVRIVEADMAGAGGSIATGEGSVWVRGGLTLLEEIDEETGEILARYGPKSSGGGGVVVANGYVWASRPQDNDLKDTLRLELR